MRKNIAEQWQEFSRLWGGFRASRVILTANNFGVFGHLKSPKTAGEIAGLLGTDMRATGILLDAVTALGLLKKSGDKYRNTPSAKKFLLKESPWYQGDMLRHADALWKTWSGLDEVVRTGIPNRAGSGDHAVFIRAMHNNAVLRTKDVIDALDLRSVRKALDLGGGPGTYSRELARKGVSVTLFDLPDTIEIAKDIIKQAAVKSIQFLAGDFHSDDIGSGYDLIFVSQILHSLSETDSLTLLEKAAGALNPKGTIAIHEFYLDKSRAFPVPGALFSVNMIVNTPSGRSYTPQEIKKWLVQAGFRNIKVKILGDTVLVTGIKW